MVKEFWNQSPKKSTMLMIKNPAKAVDKTLKSEAEEQAPNSGKRFIEERRGMHFKKLLEKVIQKSIDEATALSTESVIGSKFTTEKVDTSSSEDGKPLDTDYTDVKTNSAATDDEAANELLPESINKATVMSENLTPSNFITLELDNPPLTLRRFLISRVMKCNLFQMQIIREQ
ncbi:hypothetical protein ACTXT7_003562 [Hymenolepis weldensis]